MDFLHSFVALLESKQQKLLKYLSSWLDSPGKFHGHPEFASQALRVQSSDLGERSQIPSSQHRPSHRDKTVKTATVPALPGPVIQN